MQHRKHPHGPDFHQEGLDQRNFGLPPSLDIAELLVDINLAASAQSPEPHFATANEAMMIPLPGASVVETSGPVLSVEDAAYDTKLTLLRVEPTSNIREWAVVEDLFANAARLARLDEG